VLYISLASALFVVVFAGLAMCRLAGISDRLHAAALAEWLASTRRGERTESLLEYPAFDAPISARMREAS
jgi:hypothetical protein